MKVVKRPSSFELSWNYLLNSLTPAYRLVRGSVLKQSYRNRNDIPPIFKILPSTSDYRESEECDFFFKSAVTRVIKLYSKLSGESRQQFILTETTRASYIMDVRPHLVYL